MLANDVKLMKIDGTFCIGIDTPFGFVVTYGTENWEEFREFVEDCMRRNLAFMERIAREFKGMAKENGAGVPDILLKEFPERF